MGVTTWKCQKCTDIQQSPTASQPGTAGCTNNPTEGKVHVWQESKTASVTWTCSRCNTPGPTDLSQAPTIASCPGGKQGPLPAGSVCSAGNHDWVTVTITNFIRHK